MYIVEKTLTCRECGKKFTATAEFENEEAYEEAKKCPMFFDSYFFVGAACDECNRKDDIRRAREYSAEHSLPALTGAQDQIDDAEIVRSHLRPCLYHGFHGVFLDEDNFSETAHEMVLDPLKYIDAIETLTDAAEWPKKLPDAAKWLYNKVNQ